MEFVAQITDLVHRVAEPSDRLTLEDEEPVTRYAQIMQLGDGLFMVEIARVFEAGAYNWRIGRSRADEDAENVPGDRVTGAQKQVSPFTVMGPQVCMLVFLLCTTAVGIWRDTMLGRPSIATLWCAVNSAVLLILVGIKVYKWVRRAM